MSHVSDFTQAGDKIVLDLINESNGTALVLNTVDITLHEEQTLTQKNTRALIQSKSGSGYSGSVAVEYNRLDIADFVDLYYPAGFVIPLGNTETFLDLIPEVEAGLGIRLTEDVDFEDQVIEPWEGIPNETKEITVPILPGSLIFTGTLQFTLDGNDITLDSVITSLILDGLNLPGIAPVITELFNGMTGQVQPAGENAFMFPTTIINDSVFIVIARSTSGADNLSFEIYSDAEDGVVFEKLHRDIYSIQFINGGVVSTIDRTTTDTSGNLILEEIASSDFFTYDEAGAWYTDPIRFEVDPALTLALASGDPVQIIIRVYE